MSTREGSQTRLRRGGLIVLIALGLLSMHGFAAATPADAASAHQQVRDHGAAMGISAAAADATHGPGGRHNLLHAMGQTCIWLLAGGALLFLNRWFRAALAPILTRAFNDRSGGRALCPTLHHPPNPRLATVILRC